MKVFKIMDIGRKKEQTGLDRGFRDISGKVNNRASRLVLRITREQEVIR